MTKRWLRTGRYSLATSFCWATPVERRGLSKARYALWGPLIRSLLAFGLTRSAIIVLGVVVFCAAGVVAFTKLNIEAYPNPAPVILEITAQAAGLSAEEMEKYYTIPMEVGLYPTPGVVNIRSTSFYGLSFVRVTFKYGVDYFFALNQASISLQQNVNLPGNLVPTIQSSSLVGEIVLRLSRSGCFESTSGHL